LQWLGSSLTLDADQSHRGVVESTAKQAPRQHRKPPEDRLATTDHGGTTKLNRGARAAALDA
jgi:hypothetical protein